MDFFPTEEERRAKWAANQAVLQKRINSQNAVSESAAGIIRPPRPVSGILGAVGGVAKALAPAPATPAIATPATQSNAPVIMPMGKPKFDFGKLQSSAPAASTVGKPQMNTGDFVPSDGVTTTPANVSGIVKNEVRTPGASYGAKPVLPGIVGKFESRNPAQRTSDASTFVNTEVSTLGEEKKTPNVNAGASRSWDVSPASSMPPSGGYMNGQQVAARLAEMNKAKGLFPDRPTSEMAPGTFRASGPAGNMSGRVNMPDPEVIANLEAAAKNATSDEARGAVRGMISQEMDKQTDLGPMLNPTNRAPQGMRSGIIGQLPESPAAFRERNKYALMPGSDTNRINMRRQDEAAKAESDRIRQRQDYGLAQERILGDATTAKAKAETEGLLGLQSMKSADEAAKNKTAVDVARIGNEKPPAEKLQDYAKQLSAVSDLIGEIQADPEWKNDPEKAARVAQHQKTLDRISAQMGTSTSSQRSVPNGKKVQLSDGKWYTSSNGKLIPVA